MMNSTDLVPYHRELIRVGGPPGFGGGPPFVPKPYMVYILESCLSGTCEPLLREVPIMDSASLSNYGVHVVAGYSVIQKNPGFASVPAPAPGITSPLLAIGYNEPTTEFYPNTGTQLPGPCKGRDASRPRGKKVRNSNLMALPTPTPTSATATTLAPAENSSLQTREKSKKKPRRQRRASKAKQTDGKPVPLMSISSGNPVQDKSRNCPKEVELRDVVGEATKSMGTIDIDPRRRLQGCKYCKFCKGNGEQFSTYSKHVLRNENNETVCPVLRKYVCPNCKKTGDEAHTLKYCPDVKFLNDWASQDEGRGPFRNNTRLYSSIRNSVGGRKIRRY